MTVVPRAVPAARATGGTLFAYGLLLNLMPGIFGLFLRLARQLRERAERRRIFCRYAAGARWDWHCWARYRGHISARCIITRGWRRERRR